MAQLNVLEVIVYHGGFYAMGNFNVLENRMKKIVVSYNYLM
jgi:hypothetical protein